ncbi:MAG: DUF3108 domain-containing protein [Alphaproteobacteria bacterium]|nr:DUF3108 domain-containing protein [Alphaproteobacteria bacterium]
MTDKGKKLRMKLSRGRCIVPWRDAWLKLCCIALALGLVWTATPVAAQGRLQADYEATLAGIAVARGTLNLDIGEDQYTAAFNVGSVGVVKLFKSFSWIMSVRGHVVNGALFPDSYHLTSTTGGETGEVTVTFARGDVKETSIVPEPAAVVGRIAPTEAQLRGVFDDLTSLSVHVSGNGDVATASACEPSVPVFSGWLRFDRKRAFVRLETVEAKGGYHGPVVVCAAHVVPVAGYAPEAFKEVQGARGSEVAYAPVAGTRILVPFRITWPTPFGTVEIEATRFVSSAPPSQRPPVIAR